VLAYLTAPGEVRDSWEHLEQSLVRFGGYAHRSPEARERAVQELDQAILQPRAALG
jgi:hypothetical protein